MASSPNGRLVSPKVEPRLMSRPAICSRAGNGVSKVKYGPSGRASMTSAMAEMVLASM